MANFKLSIEDLIANKNTLVTFALPINKTVQCWMVQETFDVSGNPVYESPFERFAQEFLLNKLTPGLQNFIKNTEKLSPVRVENLIQTTLTYGYTERPTFSLEVAFVSTTVNYDPRDKIKIFMDGCYPKENSIGTVIDPWNYKAGVGGESGGKIAVSIGQWFKAVNQVLVGASFQISREVTQSGYPLYVLGSIQFKPYKLLTNSDIRGYFPIRR